MFWDRGKHIHKIFSKRASVTVPDQFPHKKRKLIYTCPHKYRPETMKLDTLSIAKSLQPAYRIRNVERSQLERFKTELRRLFQSIEHASGESEEHFKNIVADFLKNVWYRDEHYINTRDRQDLTIRTGKTAKDPVGVIIEAKKPGNRAEMMNAEKPNAKALHELLRYYLHERRQSGNRDIKRLIITNVEEWFVFDAADFERHIYSNAALLKQYTDWHEKRLGAGNTDWFYKEIAAPFFEKELPTLACTHFRLDTFRTAAENNDDEQLLDLYKILSPEHLLKKPFANDANTLNKQFYDELLYILGLEEVKEGSKKLIERAGKRRQEGSLLENTLNKLDVTGKWRKAPDLAGFGEKEEEQRFSIALELCIAWLNRILFLKLLEGQLKRWKPAEPLSTFLRADFIKDFDDLSQLFFEVLNRPYDQRRPAVQQRYGNLPYLNSSLFEPTTLEDAIFSVESLDDRAEMSLAPNTVLRDANSQRRSGRMNTLHYLLAFLDAYDFSSSGKARVQADNRDVINAAVLGLIFEKINGYRDGSFFTPGFITMYMCRETLRRAILQKFNERYGWNCADLGELYNHLETSKIAEYNELVNSLRICDPAVGSGHFLVSALDELIALKSELDILCDRNGRRLRDVRASVGNDELIVTDTETDQPVEYRPGVAVSQRIQEALFHEKQSLIENCLFGVDINPKSVMICRLRLWIELLKHAYFKTADGGWPTVDGGLETLPNIDINIKTGNSLVSRFALGEDLKGALKSIKYSINDYRNFVRDYKNSRDKEVKRGLLMIIDEIKNNFRSEIGRNDPKVTRLQKLTSELYHRFTGNFLFEPEVPYGGKKQPADSLEAKREKAKAELEKEIAKLSSEIEEIKNNKIFKNAFEWRFEFPEVLDDDGRFVGFDVVVGNPPYIRQEELGAQKPHLQQHYQTFAGTADLYVYFVERGLNVLRPGGQFSYILPNKWMRAGYGDRLRQFVKGRRLLAVSDFGDLPVFEEATTYPCILEMQNAPADDDFSAANIQTLDFQNGLPEYLHQNAFRVGIAGLQDSGWTLSDQSVQNLLEKLRRAGKPLGEYVNGKIYYGIKTGLNEAFVIDAATRERLISEDPKSGEVIKPFLAGRDIKRYQTPVSDKFLIFTRRGIKIDGYPAIKKHLEQFKERLMPKPKNHVGDWPGRKEGSYQWFEIQDSVDYFIEFEEPKIIYPNICKRPEFTFDENGIYTNQKCFIISVDDDFLVGYLNSSVVFFLFRQILPKLRGDFYEPSFVYFSKFPVPEISETAQQPIISLVTRILAAKRADPQADTSALEAEIDGLVYQLYGLTEEEIGIVEGKA